MEGSDAFLREFMENNLGRPSRRTEMIDAFSSNEDFRDFLNTKTGFYDIRLPSVDSKQFTDNPLSYFDDESDLPDGVNADLNKRLQAAGGTQEEIDHLHRYIGMEDKIRGSKQELQKATDSVNSLIGKAIDSKDPAIWFRPSETLYRGSRVPAAAHVPGVGETVEFKRFRSTSPDPSVAGRFASLDGSSYLDPETAEKRFGAGNRGRIEVIEPLHGGLRLGNPLEGEDSEVLLKPAKFEVIDRRMLARPGGMDGDIEFLKYRQIHGLDPASAAIAGGADLFRRNALGAAGGVAMAATNPEVVNQVERGEYKQAAEAAVRDTAIGAISEAGLRAAAPVARRYAPALTRAAAPVLSAVAPAIVGATLFNQGRTGSLTDVVVNKAAKYVPGLRPNPRTDAGRMAGNELMYVINKLRNGRLPYSGK